MPKRQGGRFEAWDGGHFTAVELNGDLDTEGVFNDGDSDDWGG
jgi:hypothetical protein